MKKRALTAKPKPKPTTTITGDEPPSSPSSTTSSSSCVVDDDHQQNQQQQQQQLVVKMTVNINVDQEDDENKATTNKPVKRVRRKRSINDNISPKNVNAENSPSTNNVPPAAPNRRSSIYRGVTRHRWTGRFEAHLWDKSSWNSIQNKKGRQVYLGAYDCEVDAARTYDLAALKYWGPETTLNFPIENYTKEFEEMQNATKEEYLASLRRRSSGFSRGVSKYRGVARHHHNGRWEARIGRVFGNKYLYLGTFSSQEEAAQAYDLAAIEYRGSNAVTNFDISNYIGRVKNLMPKGESEQPLPDKVKQTPKQRRQKRKQEQLLLQQEQEQQQHQQQQQQQQQQKQQQEEQIQHQQIKQQIEEEEPLEPTAHQPDLPEVQKTEKETSSEFGESNLMSSINHTSLLAMSPRDDDRENPWNFKDFCLDSGGYGPLFDADMPFVEEENLLDLFDQDAFEDNIDFIFEGEGDLVGIDETYFDGCQTEIKNSENLDMKEEISPKIEDSLLFSSSAASSPSSTTSLVSCQS